MARPQSHTATNSEDAMGTEPETTTGSGEETTTPEPDSDLVKDLRKQLKAKDKRIGELLPLQDTNAFLSAGLGDLSDDHKAALRAVAGDELTTEILTAKAKALGFISETSEEQQEIQGEVQTINNTERVVSKSTAKPDNRDFTTKLREAKSQEEVMALIASEGGEHGLLVEDEF